LAAKKKPHSVIDLYDSEAPVSTEMRRVLYNLNGAAPDEKKQAILVTSAMLSEGKSLISSFLALTAAKIKGRKTLLIDFDLRRPMVHKLFDKPLKGGISDVLLDSASPRNLIKTTDISNLDIITAGKIFNNPSELFNGPAIYKIFEEMKFYYDLILVDSPPLLPVVDPMLLLEELDGAVLVIKAGATNRDVIKRARKLIGSHKDKIVGVIINNLKHTLPYYYDYSYYGYHYKPKKGSNDNSGKGKK